VFLSWACQQGGGTVLQGLALRNRPTVTLSQGLHDAATPGNLLPRRAQSSAFLEVRRTFFGRLELTTRGRWEGRRFDDLANTVPLGGYFLLDFLAHASLGGGWSLEGRFTNALGRNYHTAAAIDSPPVSSYYNQPGRELDLTVRYRFEASHSGRT